MLLLCLLEWSCCAEKFHKLIIARSLLTLLNMILFHFYQQKITTGRTIFLPLLLHWHNIFHRPLRLSTHAFCIVTLGGTIYEDHSVIWILRFFDCNIRADHVHLPHWIGGTAHLGDCVGVIQYIIIFRCLSHYWLIISERATKLIITTLCALHCLYSPSCSTA